MLRAPYFDPAQLRRELTGLHGANDDEPSRRTAIVDRL